MSHDAARSRRRAADAAARAATTPRRARGAGEGQRAARYSGRRARRRAEACCARLVVAWWEPERAAVDGLEAQAGLEVKVSPHALRHTAATRMYRATKDLRRVQVALGHRSVTTTERYVGV